MSTCEDEEELGMAWKPRCPRCFSRKLNYNFKEVGFNGIDPASLGAAKMVRCMDCGHRCVADDAELTMPLKGGYVDVPRGAEME